VDQEHAGRTDVGGVAVIGLAARLPGAGDCVQFWDNLKSVTCSVREIPPERWDAGRYYSPDREDPNRSVSKWGGFIDGVDLFDPMFFGISPREARVMDPQQRILLELAWACVEDAGYAHEALRGSRTGVFIGVMNFDYRERFTGAIGAIEGHMSTGAYGALIANRLSYHFDWRGPSMPVDTACSSSMVALHEAVHAVQRGDCEQALVGGVSVLCSPTHYVSFSKTGMLSPDGLCRSFDERANGYVRAEGAGLVLLKPLPQAIRDGDRIYGVIRGTAVNHGGKVRTVTYPNPSAQADVIAAAHEGAGVAPDSISYIEAHGTGTPKGDPIEISGLKDAFARLAAHFGRPLEPRTCGLGSLKANVGHLEPVAGIAGVIKVLLAMKHRTLPGLAHFGQLNHRIDLSDSPFYIVEHTQDWPARHDAGGKPLPRRAGVSSFGFGGVNAHAVVEEFAEPFTVASPAQVFTGAATMAVLSAKTPDRLQAVAQRLLEWLHRPEASSAELADITYTLQVGRTPMAHRLGMLAASVDELRQKLAAWCAGQRDLNDVHSGEAQQDEGLLSALGVDGRAGLVHGLVANAQYAKLLELWTRGLPVDWQALHGERRPRRIGLPTYPFARESHWVSAVEPPAAEAAVPERPMPESLSYFEERWVEQALEPTAGRPLETILCFASRSATREAFAKHFGGLQRPVRVLFVADAAGGRTDSPDTEWVTGNDLPGFREAFERLAARHGKVDAALYLWPLEASRFVRDCSPIVHLLQAAAATRLVHGPILLAAQGDADESRCHWESWIGFERSAGNALANTPVAAYYQCSGRASGPVDLERWARTLAAELQADRIESSLYEADVRQVCRLQQVNGHAGTEPAPLRKGGTYLITGGLGGLGRLFAEHLLRDWAARVVLVGRSPLDAARQKALDALGSGGGTLLYLQADVTDRAAMAACLAASKERFGPLHGVIHAAGIESWQGLQATRWEDFERVLAPKVSGTLVLDELLRDESLDFLCHFSSSSAVVGDFGGCSYAVGNRFQMAHARLRTQRRSPGRTLAINWPLWRDGGMRVGDEHRTRFYLQSTGQRLLETSEGLAAFERVWSWPASQCLVMAGEPARVRRLLRLDEAPVPLQQRIEQELLQLSGQLLQVSADRLALDRSLADFGFDSINLAAFATALTRLYGVEVLPSVFFSHPTLERLAHHLADQHTAAISAFYQHSSAAPAMAKDDTVARVQVSGSDADDIAVIGMSVRCAGARSAEEMWRVLSEGHSTVATVPADREGGWEGFDRHCGFLSGVDEFDPLFFEISPREADDMDPRQRMLLEEAWKALEDAGCGPAQLSGRCVGTFVGVEEGDYGRLARPAEDGQAPITANHNGILAGRLAYFLDLSGPAVAVNTACSSGLVALHQACQSLRSGECDTALVAGANLLLTPHGYRQMSEAGMLSAQGECFAFDERADGMVPGEAVVVLVLKRAGLARQDNDRIHALIAGSGINSDGRTNGITAPNGAAQARLIESVYRRHRIDPDQIDHVVAHGTGTRLGDPIEVGALRQAFRAFTSRSGYCALTSIKPNFGHTLAASGLLSVAGLIQALRHETIPLSRNWERPNPYIGWQDSPFFVNRERRRWPQRPSGPRMGAVSAFGMSGTNAHVVLREAVDNEAPSVSEPLPGYLFVLSAKTEKALQQKADDLAALFESIARTPEGHGRLADISYTLLERRHHFRHRCAFVAASADEAARVLRGHGASGSACCQGKVARDFRPQAEPQRRGESVLAQCASGDEAQLREALGVLAELYCQGYVPAAAPLARGTRPRLASLPSYPFLRTRHWVRPMAGSASSLPLPPVIPQVEASSAMGEDPAHETLMLLPVWDAADPTDGAGHRSTSPGNVLVLEPEDLLTEETAIRRLQGRQAVSDVVWWVPPSGASTPDDAVIAGQERGVLAGFRLIKALLGLGHGDRPLNLSVITVRAQAIGPGDAVDAVHAGVHGLVGSLAKERPNWRIRLADLPAADAVSLAQVLSLPADRRGQAWVYRHGEWYRRHLAPVRAQGGFRAPYRQQGVYIVIGGAGDIGEAWSEHLIRHHQAQIVWVGRRQRDAAIEARLARLARLGPAPEYFAADASSYQALQAVRDAVLARHGALHGVVHAAMVFANQALSAMSEPQFLSALSSKVDVSVRIAQVFGRDALDFLLFFSSMISLIKNPRQAHYAAGCAFKDAFAHQLARHVSSPVKVVNWGYWAMKKNADAGEVRLLTDLGIGLIEPEHGMKALDVLLGSSLQQVGVMRAARDLEVEGMDTEETVDIYPLSLEAGMAA